MRLIHNSRLLEFRSPFGAIVSGSSVTLRIRIEDADLEHVLVQLRTWIDGEGEQFYSLQRVDGTNVFALDLDCAKPSIVWYSFIVQKDNEAPVYLGAPWGHTGGEGSTYSEKEPPSFQLTVYRPRAVRPSWYENGMVYQIFPDRYRRDAAWRKRAEAVVSSPHMGPNRRIVDDWNELPCYDRNPDGSIRTWDFYGGSLKGIEEDLPRLADLGISAIYLNPIFEAASNHRYDTADYLKIDPLLGSEDDFKSLCQAAENLGISIILDGVFNHTGDDSVYFNRYGNYPLQGAWQGKDSAWRSAFRFHGDGSYDCWWGVANMPDFDGDSPLVRKLILGQDGVIRHWLRAGARGWRLDVADELKESLIADIKTAILEERPDGLLLGEVWEDASNKISYGQLRHYLLGDELDSAMNYPFRDIVLGFLLGSMTAADAVERIESLAENYPPEALASALNLLGSHDRPRIATVLGGVSEAFQSADGFDDRHAHGCLDAEALGLAKGRFWLASLMQMTFPGVPSIYYGDEFGLEGLSDPDNRRTLPCSADSRDYDFQTIIKNAAGLRRALPCLRTGTIRAFVPEGASNDVLAFTRLDAQTGEAATVLINRNRYCTYSVRIPALNEAATNVVTGENLVLLPVSESHAMAGFDAVGASHTSAKAQVELELCGLGSAVVHFHAKQRLQQPLQRGAGVVCHITSVPTPNGRPGTLGQATERFIDHLSAMGFRYWQVLPVNPCDSFGSPYAGPSAFAGNTALLPESEEVLRAQFEAWSKSTSGMDTASFSAEDEGFVSFESANAAWLRPFATFMAIKHALGGLSRFEWPGDLSCYDEALYTDERFAKEARFQAWCQYRFQQAWTNLRSYAHQRGLYIIGDIPMYVSEDSTDAWAEPKLFWLDEKGRTLEGAGAPPDNMAPEGQLWGNPTYRWDVHASDGYAWWIYRLRRALELYDVVRLDHFLGFHNYFSIPAGCECAEGRWLFGPGMDLFEAAAEKLGPLPFIAEDLGILTPGVRALSSTCGFSGMDVLQFANYDVRENIVPHPEKILYTGTHDTQTLLGWCASSFVSWDDKQAARDITDELIRSALASEAQLVMLPLQDILGLGDEARMNVPGTTAGNWCWQALEEQIDAVEDDFATLMRTSGRFWDGKTLE